MKLGSQNKYYWKRYEDIHNSIKDDWKMIMEMRGNNNDVEGSKLVE